MTRHIILTGGSGFIGSHLAEALHTRGDRVTVVDNFVSGNRENLSAFAKDIDLIEADFESLESHAGRIGQADAVIHLAALISGYDSLKDPLLYHHTNVLGLHALIDFVRNHNIGRVLFASSSTVYGQRDEPVMSEATLPRPASVYALSKLAGEHLFAMYGKLHGFDVCNLRLFNVYGPRQAVDHPYANVTCKFAHAAAKGLGVLRYGDGRQSRDFVYVSDVVDAFVAALDKETTGTFNVGTGQDHAINDLIEVLGDLTGTPLEVEDRPPWPNDIRQIRADMTQFEAEFGFSPKVGLRAGLAATVDYLRGG